MGKRSSGPNRKVRASLRGRSEQQYERRLQGQARQYRESTGRELAPGALRGFSGFEPLVAPSPEPPRDDGGGDGDER
jgi:hypothetical protein